MESTVIQVENLSKKFCRSLKRSLFYGTLDTSRAMLGQSKRDTSLRAGEFWALDDISFSLRKGESLGLIGANGCGKSTLLRLLSGIFPPDRGRIEIAGRMASLIAVGAGFHPHMSGAENIYLNGVLLGLARSEIKHRFNEIVEFAEIGDFIEAPISVYSSGMRVRLGFAIAIHTRPDILLVDEVMSVGDTRFRRKASSAMTNLLEESQTTLILVSHNAYTVAENCRQGLLLNKGKCAFLGDVDDALGRYGKMNDSQDSQSYQKGADFEYFRVFSSHGEGVIHSSQEFIIEFRLRDELTTECELPIKVTIFNRENMPVADLLLLGSKDPGASEYKLQAEAMPLADGTYYFQCKAGSDFHGVSLLRGFPVTVKGSSAKSNASLCFSMTCLKNVKSKKKSCLAYHSQ